MSLDWNMTKVKDHHLLHNTAKVKGEDPPFPKGSPEDREGDWQWIVTESMIFRMMGVDMGGITEENYEKFYMRNNIVSRIIGKPMRKGGEEVDFTLEDIRRRIGLTTNVHTVTDAKFKKRWWEYLEREAQSSLSYQKQRERREAEKGCD